MQSVWKFKELADMLILCVSSGQPSDADLDASLAPHIAQRVKKAIMLAVGTPMINAAQRKRTADGLKGHPNYVATNSAISRGVVTAMNWLGNPMKACSASDDGLRLAIRALAPPVGYTEDQVISEIRKLEKAVRDELESVKSAAV